MPADAFKSIACGEMHKFMLLLMFVLLLVLMQSQLLTLVEFMRLSLLRLFNARTLVMGADKLMLRLAHELGIHLSRLWFLPMLLQLWCVR